jgi:hypothetical protein
LYYNFILSLFIRIAAAAADSCQQQQQRHSACFADSVIGWQLVREDGACCF